MSTTRFQYALRFALFGLLAAFFCGCSAEAKKAKRLAKADEYFKAGDYEKAEIEYKNVIQMVGLDPVAIGRLGIIYFDQSRLARTGTYLLKAVELQPENLEVRLKLGYFYLAIGKAGDARDAALFILERDAKHDAAPFLLAESIMQPKDVADARARLQTMPANAAAVAALGLLDLRERKPKEAEARLEQALKLNPKMVPAHSGLGQIYWSQKDFDRANKSFTSAVEHSPPRSSARIQYALFNLQAEKPDVAKRFLDEMIRVTPDFLPSYILRSNIATSEKQHDETISLLDKLLAREPYHPEALLMSAQAKMAKGEIAKALATLERAVGAFPGVAQMHFQLGKVQLANGDPVKAAVSYAAAVTIAADFQAAILALAELNIRQRNFAPAVVSLTAFLQKNPANVEAQLLLADAHRNQGNLDETLAIYRKIEEAAPANAQIYYLIGTAFIQQNKRVEARKALTKAVELSPDYLMAVETLVNLDLSEKQYAAAQSRIEAHITRNPKSSTSLLVLGKIHLMQGQNEKAEAALQKSIELEPDSPIAHQLLAQIYLKAKQTDKALSNLQAATEKNPKDFGSFMLIGVLQEQKNNFPAAREAYEKSLALNPRSAGAINNLAYLLADRFGELDKAQELAQRARDLLPNHGESADTLGWIFYKKRQYDRAVTLLEEGVKKLPQNADVQFHLGMTYYMMGQETTARVALERALSLDKEFVGSGEARERLSVLSLDVDQGEKNRPVLEEALARRKDDPVVLSRLAALYERDGRVEKAISSYETALKANASNINAVLNLIRLYRTRNETAKALELAKATRKLAPSDGRIAHVVGRLAYESGDRLWAVGVLEEAARRQTGDPDVLFDLAEASYSLGQISATETALRAALEASSGFSRVEQAREYLEMISLAQDPTKAAASLNAIELSLKKNPSNVSALMAKAAVDEQKGDAKSAKLNYEKALARFPDFTPAKRGLAIFYSAHPEDDKDGKIGVELATKAREVFPNDPDVAKAFGIILFRQGNHSRAIGPLQDSIRRRETDAEVMYYLGMSQRHAKDQKAGDRSLQQALELGLTGNLAAEARKALSASAK